MFQICNKLKGIRNPTNKYSLIGGARLLHKSDDVKQHSVNNQAVERTPITAQLWQMRKVDLMKDSVTHTSAKNDQHVEPDLLTKTSEDSRLTLSYNFKKDSVLRDMYVDHKGNVLSGKLFEDLDALAGNIANAHCDDNNPKSKRTDLVTASVDKFIQSKPISVSNDLALTAQVVWVGRSSLDVLVEIHTATPDQNPVMIEPTPTRLLSSYFTFAARNKETGKSALVNKLQTRNAAEERVFSERQAVADCRKTRKFIKLSESEEVLSEQLMEAGSAIEDMPALAHTNSVLMRSTALENSLICQPQNTNTSGRVFGGFIMNRAYDLALSTCYTFAGHYPVFKEVDKIAFRKPVDIGDLLRLKSRVIYTSDDPVKPFVVVEVNVQVVRPERASSFVSNTFNFVFGFDHQVSLRKVLPVTAEEAKMLIYGSKLYNGTTHHE